MIALRPFRALHYDSAAAGGLAEVLAPPYDVIDDAELDRLYVRSPHNVVRLILNRSADRYGAAAAALADWRRRGVLVQDRELALYYYVQDFSLHGASRHRRGGLLAAVRIEPFSAGNILPHERTFPSAKADRLKLISACRANLSPIFGVFPPVDDALQAAREQAEREPPWVDVTDAGERHRVWRIAEPAATARLAAGFAEATVFIADGHHRYETALAYRDQRRAAGELDPDAPHNFLLMYLCPMDDAGLVVLPTHRLWRGVVEGDWQARLDEQFEREAVSAGEIFARLARDDRHGVVGMYCGGASAILRLRPEGRAALDRRLADVHPLVRALDVTILDSFLLGLVLGIDGQKAAEAGRLAYTHDDRQALAAVDGGEAQAAFLLRPPRMAEVEAVCRAGQTMPQKSTYFFPKLQTGLVFHLLD